MLPFWLARALIFFISFLLSPIPLSEGTLRIPKGHCSLINLSFPHLTKVTVWCWCVMWWWWWCGAGVMGCGV